MYYANKNLPSVVRFEDGTKSVVIEFLVVGLFVDLVVVWVLDIVVPEEVMGFMVETGDVTLAGVSESFNVVLVVNPSVVSVLEDIVFGVVSGFSVEALI